MNFDRRRRRARVAVLLVALLPANLLVACAAYRPNLLGSGTAALTPPIRTVLSQQTGRIDRPYLRPTPVDLSKPLDLNAVSLITVVANPDLRAQRARAGVSEAQAFDARLLPDPSVGLEFDKIISGPDHLSNLLASVVQEINALRTKHVRVEGAKEAARQVRLDLAWAEWQTAGQARIQAVRVRSLARALAVSEARNDSARSLLERTLRASGRGDLPGDRVQTARVSALDAAQQLRATQKDAWTARYELTKLLGLPPDTPITLADPTLPPPPPPSERLFQIAQSQRMDLQALRAGYASQEAAVHLAVLEQFPKLELTVNANRDTSGNKLVGGAVNFTMPAWNGNRGKIAIETATRSALKAEFENRIFQTRAEIAAAVNGLDLAWRQRSQLLVDLPGLRRFADASERAASRGDLALSTAQAARDTVRDKELALIQVEQAIQEQTIALELLTGVPLEDWIK